MDKGIVHLIGGAEIPCSCARRVQRNICSRMVARGEERIGQVGSGSAVRYLQPARFVVGRDEQERVRMLFDVIVRNVDGLVEYNHFL